MTNDEKFAAIRAENAKMGSIWSQGMKADGTVVFTSRRSAADPQEDHHLMSSFLEFDYAVKRGVEFKGRPLGNLFLYSTNPVLTDEEGPSSGFGEACLARAIENMTAPVGECNVVGDGTCLATNACAHGPGINVEGLYSHNVSLQDQLHDLSLAIISGDLVKAQDLIGASTDPRVIQAIDDKGEEAYAKLSRSQTFDPVEGTCECAACGTLVSEVRHYTGFVNGVWTTDLSLCKKHAANLPQTIVSGEEVSCMPHSFDTWSELTSARNCKQHLTELLNHDDEPRWKWILGSVRELVDQARDGLKLANNAQAMVDGMLDGRMNVDVSKVIALSSLTRPYIERFTPRYRLYRVWSDLTISLAEQRVDGSFEPAPSHMSDDFKNVAAMNEAHALRQYVEWETTGRVQEHE